MTERSSVEKVQHLIVEPTPKAANMLAQEEELQDEVVDPSQIIFIEENQEDGDFNLPPSTHKYTLVLDLDETLIHSHMRYRK